MPAPDPVRCCERLAGLPYRLFLDSAATRHALGRYSFLTADPVAVVRSKGATDRAASTGERGLDARGGDALDAVRALLAPHAAAPVPGLPPFQGGAAGYLAYDWGRDARAAAGAALRRSRAARRGARHLRLGARVGSRAVARVADLDRDAGDVATGARASARERAWRSRANGCAGRRRQRAAGRAATAEPAHPPDPRHRGAAPRPSLSRPGWIRWWDPRLGLRSSFTHAGYLDAVARVREYIFAGDIFQANLSQRFEAPLGESPWALYRRLRARNPAPFAAFLDFPEAVVLSASPERFLRVDVAGHVETRPIKGTRPRGVGPEHDAALGQALAESAKDRAENLMIVDLMRNDLSRVCAPGTVRVPELFALEHYATVHHLVSTVVGELAPGRRRARPAARRVSRRLDHRARRRCARWRSSPSSSRRERGVYCGAIGYWSVDRRARHEHRHPHGGRARRPRLLQRRRRHRRRLGSRAGVPGDARQGPRHDRRARDARMILLIDNYDSFVHNLARYVRELGEEARRAPQRRAHARRGRGAGAEPHHPVAGSVHAGRGGHLDRRRAALRADHADSRRLPRASVHRRRVRRRHRARRPAGARQDVARRRTTARASSPGCRRRSASRATTRSSSRRASLPASLRVLATADDDGEIMAVEHRDHPVVGVQFHPESAATEYGYAMLDRFLHGDAVASGTSCPTARTARHGAAAEDSRPMTRAAASCRRRWSWCGDGRTAMSDELPAVWVNGERQPPDGPHVSARDRGLTLADGVFETMRAYDGTVFRLDRHLARLAQALAALEIPRRPSCATGCAMRCSASGRRDAERAPHRDARRRPGGRAAAGRSTADGDRRRQSAAGVPVRDLRRRPRRRMSRRGAATSAR